MMEEVWKDILEYDGHYQISNLGRVKSFKRNRETILKLQTNTYGYNHISLMNNKKSSVNTIHTLVLQTFKPDEYFDGAQANHKNGIKSDNRLENLEWCTAKENSNHAVRTGLRNNIGENHYKSKLNNNSIRIIRMSYKNKYLNKYELAEIFNVSAQSISDIINNKSWKHV